jgi:hypothetical protein
MTLRKNVASQKLVFSLVNATTGAALTGATVTAKLSIDGGSSATASGSVAELANGQYCWSPAQADTNGNSLGVQFTATNAVPVAFTIFTTAADPTDSVRLGLTALPNAAAEAAGGLYTRGSGAGQINQPANGMIDANVVRNAGTAITAASGIQEVKVASIAAAAITAASIAADAITDAKVASDVTIASVTGSVGSIASGGISASSFAAGAIDASAIAADAIGSSELAASAVSEIQSGLATSSALSSLQSDVTTLLGRITSSLFSGITSMAQWLGMIAGKQTGNSTARTEIRATGAGSGTYDETTDSMEAVRDRGDAAWTTVSASAIRTAVGLASANLDTQLDALPTAAENADAVWDEDLTGHTTPDSAGDTLGSVATGTPPTASAIADAVWDEARSGHVTSGTFGEGVASVQGAVTGAVASVTGNVGGNVAGSVGSVTGNVGGNVTGSIGSLATQAKADVNAEADTALADAGVTTTVTGRIDAAISTRLASASYTAPLDASGVRSAVGLASANLDTQLDALPTNAELATALAAADDAVLAAIAALNNLSSAGAQSAAAAALTAYGAALQTTALAVKTKTDKLTFDADNTLDANVQKVNDVELTGDGSVTAWGPA